MLSRAAHASGSRVPDLTVTPGTACPRPRGRTQLKASRRNEKSPCPPAFSGTAAIQSRAHNVKLGRCHPKGDVGHEGRRTEEAALTETWFRGITPHEGPPAEIDTGVAHNARIYDYWLGGKANFPADREAGGRAL